MKWANIGGQDVVLFIARRSIDALEELCFDYNDAACRAEFCRLVPIPLVSHGPHSPQEHLPVNLSERLLLPLLVTPKWPTRRRLKVLTSFET